MFNFLLLLLRDLFNFINIDWEMCHHCLQTREISTSHTAENLAQELRQSLDEWGIYKKVFIVTTDNAARLLLMK